MAVEKKIYIVYADYGHDGYEQPEGAYSTREAARAAIAKCHGYEPRGIMELVLDAEIKSL